MLQRKQERALGDSEIHVDYQSLLILAAQQKLDRVRRGDKANMPLRYCALLLW